MDQSATARLREELMALGKASGSKRMALFERAQLRDRWRRHLFVLSGLMALLSGFTSTAVFLELTGSTVVKTVSAVLIFASGFISLIGNAYANSKESDAMFEGAASLLSIRDRAVLEAVRASTTEKQLDAALTKIKAEYAKESKKYDRYLTSVEHDLRSHYFSAPSKVSNQVTKWLRRRETPNDYGYYSGYRSTRSKKRRKSNTNA